MKILILFFLILLPFKAEAQFTLPFSTTFNCAEQNQDTLGWVVNCDGIVKAGDNRTTGGSDDAITTSANYPGGGGFRGHRYWIGPGQNNNSGSVNYVFTATDNLYIRYYVRWQAGLPLNYQKMVYFDAPPQSPYMEMGDNPTTIRIVIGGSPIAVSGWGWQNLNNGSTNSDGAWHCTEMHLQSVAGSNNDIVEWWFDGVRRMNITTANLPTSFSRFGMPQNQNTDGGHPDMYNDTDDVVIRTTGPIGCIGAAITPNPPTNLRITP